MLQLIAYHSLKALSICPLKPPKLLPAENYVQEK